MNKEDPYRDQAERLRQRIEKVKEPNEQATGLPPRSDLHRQRQHHKKTKWKLKYPVIRLLVLFFILLPIISFSVYSYFDGMKHGGVKKTAGDPQGYETINFDKANKADKNQTEDQASKDENKQIDTNAEQKENTKEEMQPAKQGNEAPPASQPSSVDQTNGTDKNGNAAGNTTGKTEPVAPEKKLVYHTVQAQETIYRIAMNYYHSKEGVAIIKQANQMKTDTIEKGQVLKIPLD